MHDAHDPQASQSSQQSSLLTSSIDAEPPALAPGRAHGGALLPAAVQAKMERSFGADLSDVRIHEGPQAPGRGALAYAQGADVFFAPGRYDPHGAAGQELLGHELAHVVQHAEGRAAGPQSKRPGDGGDGGDGDAGLEAEADEMGAAASRGELARPGAPRVRAVRDGAGGGAVLRMIDKAAPVARDWAQIAAYLDTTLVNNRKQTFRQAVEEYLACGLSTDNTVEVAWQDLEDHRDELGWEGTALARIQAIRISINTHKRDYPDHPNKRGIGSNRERYETVPQSTRSREVAADLQAEMIAQMFGSPGAKSFMLGVLVLPSGSVRVSHSGNMKPAQGRVFRRIVEAQGHTVVSHDGDYAALKRTYRTALTTDSSSGLLPHDISAQNDAKDGNKHKVIHWGARTPIEKGNPTGVCAAPQVIHPVDGEDRAFPPWIGGYDDQLALTEVLVRDTTKPVTVLDQAQHQQHYDHNAVDVPSCLTCQHQLRALMTKLVNLRRNVVNLDDVRFEEGDRDALYSTAWELRDLVEEGRAATLVLGKDQVTEHYSTRVSRKIPVNPRKPKGKQKTVWEDQPQTRVVEHDRAPMVGADDGTLQDLVAQLEDEIDGYRGAVQTQAIERTKHPEFVERAHRVVGGLGALEDAEDAAATEFEAHRFEAMWQRRQAVGLVIGGERYNTEREKVSKTMKVKERADGARLARSRHSDEDAAQQTKAEDVLREQAGKAALESSQARDARSEEASEGNAKAEDALREQAGKAALESSQARDARSEEAAEGNAKAEDALREQAGKAALESSQARDARSEEASEGNAKAEEALREEAGKAALGSSQARDARSEEASEGEAKAEEALREQAGKAALGSSQARDARSEEASEGKAKAEEGLRDQAAQEARSSAESRETLDEVRRVFQLAMALAQALDAHLRQALQGATEDSGDGEDGEDGGDGGDSGVQ